VLLDPAPLIAINPLLEQEGAAGPPLVKLRTRYIDAVQRAGGVPIIAPPLGTAAEAERLLERVDGHLLTGGDDFCTERLGLGPTHPAAVPTLPQKQDHDMDLARVAIGMTLPTLGICYGMQLLHLAEGGALLQHLPEDLPGCLDHTGGVEHLVDVQADTKLADLLGVEELTVVSRHHQAITAPTGNWRITGTSPDGVIEAIERPDLPYAVGVQWHPELSPPGTSHDGLFLGLVSAASARLRKRRTSASPTHS